MTRIIATSMVVLLLAASPVTAALVIVGDHPLRPNQPDQIVQIEVTGGELIQGMELRAMIGGAGLVHGGIEGPIFKVPGPTEAPSHNDPNWAPAMFPGTIWEGFLGGSARLDIHPDSYTPHAQLFMGGAWTNGFLATVPAGTPTETAVLVNLIVDTTSYTTGTWDLELSNTPDGDTQLLEWITINPGDPNAVPPIPAKYDMQSIPLTFDPGSIRIAEPLDAVGTGNWNAGGTWDGGAASPTIYDMVTVDGQAVTVDSDAGAFSLSIASGTVHVAAARSLTVVEEVSVAAPGTLAGSGTVGATSVDIAGHVAPGASVGTLTIADAAVTLGATATYDAEVNLATADADQIKLTGAGSLQLGGTLKVAGVGRTSSATWDSTSRQIVYGPVTGDFDAVVPTPGTTIASHVGQGAFLREVNVTANSVDLDLFIALGGDSDGDGKIWLSDWAALRANFGNAGIGKTWTDGNSDPWVDDKVWLSDWAALRANFGNGGYTAAEGGAAAVPE
ncbi:MAG: hypothetical protein HQ567_34050, partial [Candidatus Nealsonbacteria bacterium]|nr:hypothetical protein [Candidatus Nealsonbacteria bacterium]